MPPQKLVSLKSDHVQLKRQMDLSDFQYFTTLIQNNVYEDWIKEKKVSHIRNSIDQFLGETFKRDYIIIIGVDPCYSLSYKKNCFLIVKIEKITMFIYQPKPTEFPKIKPLESFNNDPSHLQSIRESINTVQCLNIDETQLAKVDRVKSYLAALLIKFAGDFFTDASNYETLLVTKIRQILCIVFQSGFWQIYVSKRLETLVTLNPNEVYLEFTFQPLVPLGDTTQTPMYKIVMFQKQGPQFNLKEKVKLKSRELISFLFLSLFFITLVTCKIEDRDQYLVPQQNPQTVREHFCYHKQEILGFSAMGFFALIIYRMMSKYIDRTRDKRKMQEQLNAKAKLE